MGTHRLSASIAIALFTVTSAWAAPKFVTIDYQFTTAPSFLTEFGVQLTVNGRARYRLDQPDNDPTSPFIGSYRLISNRIRIAGTPGTSDETADPWGNFENFVSIVNGPPDPQSMQDGLFITSTYNFPLSTGQTVIGLGFFLIGPSTLLSSDALIRPDPAELPSQSAFIRLLPEGSTSQSDAFSIFAYSLTSIRVTPENP